jgi:hypothetical protein
MSKGKKAQAANELLIIFMFAFFIFVTFLSMFARQKSEEVLEAKVAVADQIGSQFADEINLAARGGDGYSKKFSFPLRLEGVTPYTIILNKLSNSIDINFSRGTLNFSHSFPLIINAASKTRIFPYTPQLIVRLPDGREYGYIIFSTDLTVSRGYIYIQNVRGVIIINSYAPIITTPYSISVTTSPKEIPGDMVSTSNITVQVLDQWYLPVKDGTPVRFSTDRGYIQEVATTKDGTAVSVLTSPLVNFSNPYEMPRAYINISVSNITANTYVDFTYT